MSPKWKYIILSVNLLLIFALVFCVIVIAKTNDNLRQSNEQIANDKSVIEEITKKAEKLESDLKTSEENNKKTASERDSLKSEKEKLQSENQKLKTEIEQLKAKKNGSVKSVVNAASQSPSSSQKICYLTFDDGPSKNTPEILKILDKYGVKATFFVIDTAQSNISYVSEIHAAGHTVGLHSSSHNYSKIYKSVDAYFADLNKISDKVKSITGEESKVIRFPGGSSNLVSRQHSKGIMSKLTASVTQKGYSYFDWNVDSGDATGTTVSQTKILNNVLNGAKNKNSICVLMHDSGPKTTTVAALPKIIEGLSQMGYRFDRLKPGDFGFHHGVNN